MAGENDNNAVISNLQQQNQLLKEKIEAIQASLNSAQEKISTLEIQLPPLENLEMGSVLATAQLTLQQSSDLLITVIAIFSILIAIAGIFGWREIKKIVKENVTKPVVENQVRKRLDELNVLKVITEIVTKHINENKSDYEQDEGVGIGRIEEKDDSVDKNQLSEAKRGND